MPHSAVAAVSSRLLFFCQRVRQRVLRRAARAHTGAYHEVRRAVVLLAKINRARRAVKRAYTHMGRWRGGEGRVPREKERVGAEGEEQV